MKQLCLTHIVCGTYIRVAENCKTPNNLGLIIERKRDGECSLWVKKEPSASGAKLYSATTRSTFKPHKNNPDSTPRGGSGYLGGRKFPTLKSLEAYLGDFGKVAWCTSGKKRR
jgi:hypothetical protein